MYKLMLADDEGAALDALRVMISQNYGDACDIRLARTANHLFDVYQKYHPDILLLNTQMAGIHGIFSLRELHSLYHDCLFIVISHSRKLNYSREGTNMGVRAYLTKPFRREKLDDVLKKLFQQIDQQKRAQIQAQINKEKFDTVIPVLENGMISDLLFSGGENLSLYTSLLDIRMPCGWLMELTYSQITEHGTMCNPIGSLVQLQKQINFFHRIIKAFFPHAVIGPVLANTVMVLVPCPDPFLDQEAEEMRQKRADNMSAQLYRKLKLRFRVTLKAPARLEELARPLC